MDRNDFITSREDVIENVLTLNSYLESESDETREWAKDRIKKGKWFVVEPYQGKLLFAPSRFVGYVNNTKEKNSEDPGDGKDTNRFLKKIYKECESQEVQEQFNGFLKRYSIESSLAEHFMIPIDLDNTNYKDINMQENKCDKYIELLKANHNIVLTGAPGTGKTYLAKEIAKAMGAETGFVQFHPSYDYTDFVEGLRPTSSDGNGNIGFERKDGVFKEFCKKAIGICKNVPVSTNEDIQPVKIEEVEHEPANIGNEKSFYSLYDELKRRIKAGTVTLYTVYPRTTMEVKVEGNDILYKKGDRFMSNYISMDYVKRIYDYYRGRNVYDITHASFGDFCNIIGNTLNYTYYRGIVQELLNMSKSVKPLTQYVSEMPISKTEAAYSATSIISDNDASKAIQWFIDTQDGIRIKSNRGYKIFIVQIYDGKVFLKSEDNTPHYVNLKAVKRFITSNGEDYNRDHQTYEPTVGQFILDNYFANKNIEGIEDDAVDEDITNNITEVKDERKPFIFIIDEINRGEISKIFGELFFSIDPGYRGEEGRVKTQYQNLIDDKSDPFFDGFYVPDNVYIIGTMNDIDRSVESMDFAMRRRFTWVEVSAEESIENMGIDGEKKDTMIRINDVIKNMDGLGKDYELGGAYFLDSEDNPMTKEMRWEYRIEPLLREYLRGTNNVKENMKKLKAAYDGKESNDDKADGQ